MEVSINLIRQGKHLLVAACDLNVLGKTLKFGNMNFNVSRDFYGGACVSAEEAVSLMQKATTVNMVGSAVVKKAIEKGLIHPKSVIKISGIPHAQIVKM